METFDLKRAGLGSADVAFLLVNKFSKEPVLADHKNILTGLAMKKYVNDQTGNNLRLCMQLIKSDSKQHFTASICPHKQRNED